MSNYSKLYSIYIAESETGFLATLISHKENKGMSISAPRMRLLLAEINKQIKKRSNFLRRFPMPLPRSILTIEESLAKPANLVIGSNGN